MYDVRLGKKGHRVLREDADHVDAVAAPESLDALLLQDHVKELSNSSRSLAARDGQQGSLIVCMLYLHYLLEACAVVIYLGINRRDYVRS